MQSLSPDKKLTFTAAQLRTWTSHFRQEEGGGEVVFILNISQIDLFYRGRVFGDLEF